MNTDTDTIDRRSAARFNGRSISIDVAALAQMPARELRHFREGISTILEVSSGLACQPRFLKDEGHAYNQAGDQIERLCEWLGKFLEATFEVARESSPATAREAEERSWCILQTLAGWSDGLDEMAVEAAKAARDYHRAQWRELHPSAGKAVAA